MIAVGARAILLVVSCGFVMGKRVAIHISQLYAGSPQPLGDSGRMSAILKKSIPAPWRVTKTGLVGDHQADLKNHGGPDKALHHYPFEHYAFWARELPVLAEKLVEAPAFGENFSTVGLTEENVCIGDVYQIGDVVVQVSQGRQPCWKLNERFGPKEMARLVQNTGRTGWYYRVLQEGIIQPDDCLQLSDRRQPDWSVSRINDLFYQRSDAYEELAALAVLPELAEGWRKLAERRVKNRNVEDWSERLGS